MSRHRAGEATSTTHRRGGLRSVRAVAGAGEGRCADVRPRDTGAPAGVVGAQFELPALAGVVAAALGTKRCRHRRARRRDARRMAMLAGLAARRRGGQHRGDRGAHRRPRVASRLCPSGRASERPEPRRAHRVGPCHLPGTTGAPDMIRPPHQERVLPVRVSSLARRWGNDKLHQVEPVTTPSRNQERRGDQHGTSAQSLCRRGSCSGTRTPTYRRRTCSVSRLTAARDASGHRWRLPAERSSRLRRDADIGAVRHIRPHSGTDRGRQCSLLH